MNREVEKLNVIVTVCTRTTNFNRLGGILSNLSRAEDPSTEIVRWANLGNLNRPLQHLPFWMVLLPSGADFWGGGGLLQEWIWGKPCEAVTDPSHSFFVFFCFILFLFCFDFKH